LCVHYQGNSKGTILCAIPCDTYIDNITPRTTGLQRDDGTLTFITSFQSYTDLCALKKIGFPLTSIYYKVNIRHVVVVLLDSRKAIRRINIWRRICGREERK